MKLSEQLQKKADQLVAMSPELTALGLLKKAGIDEVVARTEIAQDQMEKVAYSKLVDAGIDYDAAINMVKAANVRISELPGFKAEPTEAEKLVNMLTKAAAAVDKLEDEVESLREAQGGLIEKVAGMQEILDDIPEFVEPPSDSLIKLAELGGFDSDDLEALSKMSSTTLSKIASSINQEPWTMGKSAGMADASGMDPLTAFLMS